ncbi:MAG: DUF11 domain-containing protein [Xanthomonadales bacterium]|nr:DUF11 domain-containing protein [Xanthomonadales bacterium]
MKFRSLLLFATSFGLAAPLVAQDRETVNPAEALVVNVAPTVPMRPLGSPILQDGRPQLVTHPGIGAGGADVSRLQNTTLSMTTLGLNIAQGANFRMTDDFVVPASGWTITDVSVYGYQTGSTTTSTFTGLNFQIWNGNPSVGGSAVVFGDTTTNRMTATSFSNIYRDSEGTPGGTTRPIMTVTAGALSIALPAGTYWLDWQLAGSLGSGPWAPPITIIGRTTTGNAMRSNAGVWAAANDGGTVTQQGFPITLAGVPSEADVSLTKTAVVAGTLAIGSNFNYDLTVSNAGPAGATGVVVTDTLPAQVTYVSNTCGATYAAPTLTWNVGALANAANATCSITVTVAQTGAIDNTATVTSTTTDPNPANDAASASVAGALDPPVPVPALSLWAALALLAGVLGAGWIATQRR